MKKVRITQIRSGIGRPQDQKDTLKSLNLRKMHQTWKTLQWLAWLRK